MNIAILGGSFDPPHNGHLLIAHEIKRVLSVDEVWMVPVFSHPFNKHVSSVDDRLAMTKLLEKDFIKVLDIEAKEQKTSYSIETLDTLQKQFPTHTFSWIIGSDQIRDFPKWKNWERIVSDYRLIIFERPEHDTDLKKFRTEIPINIEKNITLVSAPVATTSTISSSEIREKVKRRESIAELVPQSVESYIKEHQLYL